MMKPKYNVGVSAVDCNNIYIFLSWVITKSLNLDNILSNYFTTNRRKKTGNAHCYYSLDIKYYYIGVPANR